MESILVPVIALNTFVMAGGLAVIMGVRFAPPSAAPGSSASATSGAAASSGSGSPQARAAATQPTARKHALAAVAPPLAPKAPPLAPKAPPKLLSKHALAAVAPPP